MVYVFLADGFEEIEALTSVDILRRLKINVLTVGITGKTVMGSHGIPVIADIEGKDIVLDNKLDAVMLPGGLPGTVNLENSKTVIEALDFAAKTGKIVSAICAAPSVLGHKGLLNGREFTCYPGFEKDIENAVYHSDRKTVVSYGDYTVVTGSGMGAAFEFGLALAGELTDKEEVKKLGYNMKFYY